MRAYLVGISMDIKPENIKYDMIEKFNDKNSFVLYYGRMFDLLSHWEILKAFHGKKKLEIMNDNDWEKLETRVYRAIRLNLVDDVVYPLLQIKSSPELWAKLESFYMMKSLTNKRYLKKQLYFMKMSDFDSL